MPRITDFCNCIYVFGCRLNLVGLCDSDFGITPLDDITIGINCAAFCFHMEHISFASSWYFFCLSVIVLARLCVFGTAMSIKKVVFVFLFIKVISGRLKGIVFSVSMLRFQYSSKFSFSSTLAGVLITWTFIVNLLLLLLLLLLLCKKILFLTLLYEFLICNVFHQFAMAACL